MSETILRELAKRDYAQVEAMIKQTWHFEKHCGNEISARRMAKLYLRDALAEQNAVIVAEENGKIIGTIMMRDDKCGAKASLKQKAARLFATANVMRAKAGRKGHRIYKKVNIVDRSLLATTGREFGGELTFFAVADKAQGKGVGKKLLGEAREYFYARGCQSFYVFTDTACNYGFYDSQGFKKIAEKPLIGYNMRKSGFVYFMYEYDFAQD